ncbi:MAG: flagellar biosynthetic protein FliO [Lachnospiraceae bacterium]|nr:flagellar biosynthetic protein FliO [Lachnospiraceae bacterium]
MFTLYALASAPAKTNTLENILTLIGLLFAFIVILFLSVKTTQFVAKRQFGNSKATNFKLIESYMISQGTTLQLIKIGDKFFVISASKDSARLIAELPKDSIVIPENGVEPPKDFKSILKAFSKEKTVNQEEKG